MQTTVTVRHAEVPDEVRSRALELMERLTRIAHRPQRADVVFDDDHQRKVVELRVHLPRGAVAVASAEAADFRTALDRAGEKLRRQLAKDGDRTTRRASA